MPLLPEHVPGQNRSITPNHWDLAAFLLVMGAVALLAWGSRQMTVPCTPGQQIPLSLDPLNLPVYALRSVLRMAAEDEADRVLQVAIEWGRYAELFAYQEGAGILSLENPESVQQEE